MENISSMVVNIGKFASPLMYNYTYDQLNRITQMDVDSGFNQTTNTWNMTPINISDYKERVAYDPNGNITKYLRNGTSTVNLNMDSLSYFYNRDANGRLLNNKLNYIRDEVSGTAQNSNYPSDIDDQSSNNYAYDSIGNLVKDNAESITSIKWSVYGKILEIQRTATGANPMTDLQYTYDASGNRISKMVTNSSGPIVYTWYARDAQGNVMSTYTSSGTGVYDSLYSLALSEQHLYGSSRLGILSRNTDMKASYTAPTFLTFQRGYKNYELSNHLGNVLVTISDKKLGISSNGSTIDNFTADVRNANDYYPFGMLEPGRSYTASNTYRYGFNGKENDNEAKGPGNELDYGMRIYDPRSGRFLSSDPLQSDYPSNSTYSFAENDVIRSIDLDGLEKYILNTDDHINPITKQTEYSRHLFLNRDVELRGRGLIGYFGDNNKMLIINDPNELSIFDKKVYDYALNVMQQKNISGASIKMPSNTDIKLKTTTNQKVGNTLKPRPKIESPKAEEVSMSLGVYMKPGSDGGDKRRNELAVNQLLRPRIESLVTKINSKGHEVNRIDISVTLITNTSNKTQIQDIKNRLNSIYPKAKIDIKYDPNYYTSGDEKSHSSNEDFGYKIDVKGYKK